MSGMNPGFAAYLAKKKAGASAPAKPAPKGKVDPNMKANAKHAVIKQRASEY